MSAVQPASDHAKALNHLALHYRPGDSDRIVRLFRTLGLRVEDLGPGRNGDRSLRVVIDASRPDGFFFVSTATPAQLQFEATLEEACGGALGAYRQTRQSDPEAGFHIAVRYDSLEAVEQAIVGLRAVIAEEPGLAERLSVIAMKAHSSDNPAIAERMASSPVFGPEDREAFGEGIVQVFVSTDLVAGGLLSVGQTIELDYIFPGRRASFAPVRVYDDVDAV